MPTIETAIDDFLAQKRIAVAGVSREPGGTALPPTAAIGS